ncbi:hypothetical protein ABT160_28480 [Streptomyces sp. NPDC001941]|uniref:hypothetical protein n=1 Tax=Streptomyces sp. NPDC001941 TaxID=3154659 RepID=UPI0033191C02
MHAHNADVVRAPAALGKIALNLVFRVGQLGPVLYCADDQVLLIPVPHRTAHWWYAPHSQCRPGPAWWCDDLHAPRISHRPCTGRIWMLHQRQGTEALTDPRALFDALSSSRATSTTPTHPVAQLLAVSA